MGLSNDLSCEAGSLSCCCPQPPRAFSITGLRLYFPTLEPWFAQSASLSHFSSRFINARMWGRGVLPPALPALFSTTLSPALLVYLCANVGLQGLPVVRLPAPFVPHSASLDPTRVLSVPAAHLCPSYWSG